MASPILIKKYGNRRLYDTEDSRYITMDELAKKVRGGTDVRVVEAKSGQDLTQATLTQIIVEGRGAAKLLPVPLLIQMIRLGDDALAEFLGQYMTTAMQLYLRARRGAEAVSTYNPFATLPFTATDALARLFMSPMSGFRDEREVPRQRAPSPEPEDEAQDEPGRRDDIATLRAELDELKQMLRERLGNKK